MFSCHHVRRVNFHRVSRSFSTHEHVKNSFRELLRHTAQPVAVVTSLMRSTESDHLYHGATLSSFTSIAMEPHPLVSFSLRIPSRMSHSLKSIPIDTSTHMVINLLAADQADTALYFSRPDKHPNPFSSISYSLTADGIPIIDGALGALSCFLVSPAIPLHDLDHLQNRASSRPSEGPRYASELYIARVTGLEEVAKTDGTQRAPLLYYNRTYTTAIHAPSK